MANYNKKKAQEKVEETPIVVEETPIVEETTIAEEEKPIVKKTFSDTDLIPCVSITPGELFVVGDKSKNLYTFADNDYLVEIEYRDLKYAAASRDKMMYRPRYIVQDRDFLKEFPELEKVYGDLYSGSDLQKILKLSPSEMKRTIEKLPLGAKDALKSIAATQIDNKQLDSIQRVKVLDEVFGTELMTRLVD